MKETITRRTFLGAAMVAALSAPLTTLAQQPAKVWRIGLFDYASDPASSLRWKALRDRLRELGYVEGQNVVFESRAGDGHVSRLQGLATELVEAKMDLIVTAGSEAAVAVRQATASIPIVTAASGDPVQLRMAGTLARPGGNVTGVTSMTGELGGKRLELLKQLVPRATRVAVLRDPENRGPVLAVKDAERVARPLGVALQTVDVRDASELEAVFQALKRSRVDAAIFIENTVYLPHRQRIADLALTHRLPMMAAAKEYAQAGVLVSYGTDYLDLFRRAAGYVDRILKGAKPADLPIEQPTKFELVINLKTVKALGLTIPPAVLARADEVIQ